MKKLETGYADVPKIQKTIKESSKILLLTHSNPDPDAIGSILALYYILTKKYLEKDIKITVEDGKPDNLTFLKKYEIIEEKGVLEVLKKMKPDLIILTDTATFHRVSKEGSVEIEEYVRQNKIEVVALDHHVQNKQDYDSDVLINNHRSSACEEVYEVFIKRLGFHYDFNVAQALMVGVLSDTNRFLYHNDYLKDTFEMSLEFSNKGVEIERLNSKMRRYPSKVLPLLAQFIQNTVVTDECTYSFLTDKFYQKYVVGSDISSRYCSLAYHMYIDDFGNNIDDNLWSWVVYPDWSGQKKMYRGGFRSVNGVINTTVFATLLDGGGHKTASGFRFEAESLDKAKEQILQLVKENLEQAKKEA